MFKEIKESWGYEIGKKLAGAAADIGGGAIAGAAAAMVPIEGMPWWKRAFVGVGVYGIAKWVGKNSKEALIEDMDKTMNALVDMVDPAIEMYTQAQEKAKETETETESVTVDSSSDNVVDFEIKN
jgi:hypothetical protein